MNKFVQLETWNLLVQKKLRRDKCHKIYENFRLQMDRTVCTFGKFAANENSISDSIKDGPVSLSSDAIFVINKHHVASE